MRRWLGLAARLYPRRWRDRYGDEFGALLDGVEPRWADLADILRGAAMMQLKTWSSSLKLVGVLTLAGAVIAIAVSFFWPKVYVSSAVIRAGAYDPQVFQRAWRDVTTRHSLSELIQRPDLNLYRGQRNRQPLEDVIEEMKTKGLRIEPLKEGDKSAYRVSFAYEDRYKAQAVVDAITGKVIDAGRMAERASFAAPPANLPQAPVAPDRVAFLAYGLCAGLLIGVVVSLLRWRARWTLAVAGFGLAGCAAVSALSLLIPNQYTSKSTLRVFLTPAANAVPRYMQEAEMAAWLRKKELEILSDESLGEIIQRRSLDLYHKQREQQPVTAVLTVMRRNLKIEAPHSRSEFTISFTYPDRFKTQAVVSALVTKFVDSEFIVTEADLMVYHPPRRTTDNCIGKTGYEYVECISGNLGPVFPSPVKSHRRNPHETLDLLDSASLPETPVAPNRFVLAGAGLFAGLFLGIYAKRRKPAATLRPA